MLTVQQRRVSERILWREVSRGIAHSKANPARSPHNKAHAFHDALLGDQPPGARDGIHFRCVCGNCQARRDTMSAQSQGNARTGPTVPPANSHKAAHSNSHADTCMIVVS